MKWIKRKLSKLFLHEDLEDLHEEELENHSFDEHPLHTKNMFQYPMDESDNRVEDDSMNHLETSASIEKEVFFDQMRPTHAKTNSFYMDSNIYDVENPGIRDLLANRGKHKKTEQIVRSRRIDTVETPPAHRAHKKSEQMLSEFKKEISLPTQNKKRFTPTKVPSPVYGFAKPSKLNALLTNRSTEPSEQNHFVLENKQKPENDEITVEQQVSIISQEILVSNEQCEERNIPPEHVEEVVIEPQVIEEEQKRDETRIPFNVLMLQSDKAKLQAKIVQKQNESMLLNKEENKEPVVEQIVPIISAKVEVQQNIDINNDILSNTGYAKPSMYLLEPPEEKIEDIEWMESQAEKLVEALSYFQVTAHVESVLQGPAVTQFEITVSQGTKVSKIRNLADDLKLALAAKDIRIQAPIPGKSSIGIEIPNRKSRAVRLSEVTSSETFIQSESPLEAALGLDLTGKPVTIDLRKMPHGLIAGATGSGKSVCINSLLISLLYKSSPHELKLMLIDPKVVELAPFNHIPHLVSPVITDVKAATAALKWAVEEMERRYQLFAEVGVRDLPRYNAVAESKGQYSLKLPYILIVIDELADLMMMSPADVEEAICRIAQKARACGIHLIVATQRPSVDVITGLIKSNIPTRIAFAVSSQIDSRTILDSQGAERLLGRGDMLYLGNGMSDAIRIQGTFVTDDEIEAIIDHVRKQGKPDYFFNQEELLKKIEISEEQDDLFEEVCRFVYEQGSASTSLIQRKYHIGYNRAARLIDMLEQNGYVSEQRGSKARDVYITESDLAELFD